MITALKQSLLFEPDDFLSLFPHRSDFIWAEYPDPETSPQWKTESRYPLHDRIIRQGEYLYGVRFGPKTFYVMLDVDISSPYHPIHSESAMREIMNALEPLGLVRAVKVKSSDRKGIHLFFPFEQAQKSYLIATAVKACLEQAGFKVQDGWIEIFPNSRPYSKGKLALYKAHRLPLQRGSDLLDRDNAEINATRANFVTQWKLAQVNNCVDRRTVERISQHCQRKSWVMSQKAAKFLDDLNTIIEPGWTGRGQTNFLLGRIAYREYIFHHIITGGEPLTGEALTARIVAVARSLPGYHEFCNHQDEIETKARGWARLIESNPNYYPYSPGRKLAKRKPLRLTEPIEPTLNQQRATAAQDRICQAMAELTQQKRLPAKATARLKALKAYGISPQTLYKYKNLWHPKYNKIDHTPVETEVDEQSPEPAQAKEFHTSTSNKLVPTCAVPTGQAQWHQPPGGSGGETSRIRAEVERQITLAQIQQAAARRVREIQQQERHQQEIQGWLNSADPILQAEARGRLTVATSAIDENDVGVFPLAMPPPICTVTAVDDLPLADQPIDLSSVIAEIEVESRRLRLSRPELQATCLERFRQSIALLEDQQLLQLRDDLRARSTPQPCTPDLSLKIDDGQQPRLPSQSNSRITGCGPV